MFKKVISISLVMLFCLGLLSACGESVELLAFIDSNSSDDLDGYEFKLMQTFESDGSSGGLSDENLFGYPANSVLGDAILKRISDIESELKCDIQISTNNYDGSLLASMVMADSLKYEAMYSSSHEITMNLAAAQSLHPISDFSEYVDFKNAEKYGTPNVFEINSYKGEMYGLTPISWIYKEPRAIGITVFNMDLVDKYGFTNPREYLENKAWNWDTMETVISNYYVNEGDKTVYSMACRSFDFIKLSAMGNGTDLFFYDEKGLPASDFGSDEMMSAFDWYYHLVDNYSEHFALPMNNDNGSWELVKDAFCIQQNSVACVTAPNVLYYDIIYTVNEFAVLPFPTGPNGIYGEWPAAMEAAECFSVFVTAKEPENCFRIIDSLAEPLDGYETPDLVSDYLAELTFYDKSDVETVLNVYKYGEYTYWTENDGKIGNMYRAFVSAVNSKTSAEVLSAQAPIISNYINEFLAPNMAIYDYFE